MGDSLRRNCYTQKKEEIINSIKEKVCKDIITTIEDVKVPKRFKHLYDSSNP